MTMPDRIWAGQPPHDYTKTRVWLRKHDFMDWERGSSYIRADIAEELARALEEALTMGGCGIRTLDALDKYNEATKCSQ